MDACGGQKRKALGKKEGKRARANRRIREPRKKIIKGVQTSKKVNRKNKLVRGADI